MKRSTSKQTFRPQLTAEAPARKPSYPTLEVGRRRFLRRLGAVAGGALGFAVIGCTIEDAQGSPPMPNVDWRRDVRRRDAGPPDGLDAETLDVDAPDGPPFDAGSRDVDTLDGDSHDADTPDGSR